MRHVPNSVEQHKRDIERQLAADGRQSLSLITFLLCITAAVGIGMMLLHMLSLSFR